MISILIFIWVYMYTRRLCLSNWPKMTKSIPVTPYYKNDVQENSIFIRRFTSALEDY